MYEGCSYVTHDPGPLEDEEFHDYTEVPDLEGVPSSFHSNSSGYHSNGSSVQSRHHLPGSLDRWVSKSRGLALVGHVLYCYFTNVFCKVFCVSGLMNCS